MSDKSLDEELLADLGLQAEEEAASIGSKIEERMLSGFEEIENFFEKKGAEPSSSEDKDIFERLYAVRLRSMRESPDCRAFLASRDKHGLLTIKAESDLSSSIDDQALLAELGVIASDENDISQLRHVRTRGEIHAAEEVAHRKPCVEFDKKFKALFAQAQKELRSGLRQTREWRDARISVGDLFIIGGQKVYVAEVADEGSISEYNRPHRRLRVIYDNGTENDILLHSLQSALYKDKSSRRITTPDLDGPLFSGVAEVDDNASGTVYVLRSKSDHPLISKNRNVIHKIGVTGTSIEKRIATASTDPTFLMAEVEVIASYELSNITRSKLESIIHNFFESARLRIEIKDRFGNPVVPREWFLVPLFIINEAIERIKDGSIVRCRYDVKASKIIDDRTAN